MNQDRIAFLFRTDVHTADHSPESWKGDYPSEIWSSLEQIGDLARKFEVEAVLDGGDFFHVKAPSRTSHYLVSKVSAIHRDYPCPVFCVEGNHDIKHNNLDTLEEQPLGVLYNSGVFRLLRDELFERGSLKVRVVGHPYNPFQTLEALQATRKTQGEYLVSVVHALAGESPPDHVEEFFGEPVFRYRDLVVDQGPDIYAFGHWHKDQGIVEIEGRYFVNQGAVSRGALSKENLDRTPKVALLEFFPGQVKVTPICLNVAPAEEVFDLGKKERKDTEKKTIEDYVAKVRVDLAVAEGDDIASAVRSLSFAKDVHDLALEYLELGRGSYVSEEV